MARSDGGKDGGAVSCAFLGFDEFNFVRVNIGLNLTPECRPRASPAQPDCRHRNPKCSRRGSKV